MGNEYEWIRSTPGGYCYVMRIDSHKLVVFGNKDTYLIDWDDKRSDFIDDGDITDCPQHILTAVENWHKTGFSAVRLPTFLNKLFGNVKEIPK